MFISVACLRTSLLKRICTSNMVTNCTVNYTSSSDSSDDDDGRLWDNNNEQRTTSTGSSPADSTSGRNGLRFSQEERQAMFKALKSQVIGGVQFESLTKRSQKKLVYLRLKRELQKSMKKENRSKRADSTDGSRSDDDDTVGSVVTQTQRVSKRIKREEQNARLREAMLTGLKVAIDCSMEDVMSPKEICRLARQINWTYFMNRAAVKPFHLYLTGLVSDSKIHRELHRQCIGFDSYLMDAIPTLYHQLFPCETIVYLTPDSPNVLDQLDNDKVYVLGGLVDESLENNYTYDSAQKLSISTARLPIDVYMEKTLPSVHCALSINQVVGVLLDVYSGKGWGTSLETHVPRRKGYVLKKKDHE